MRVGMLAPIAWRTPPVHYGPWELVTSLLTEGLVRRGVDVTLFATADSVTAATLDSVVPHGYAEDPELDGRVWEAIHVAHALERSGEFDLLHNQLDWLPLAFSRLSRAPLVTTVHGFSGSNILPAYARSRSAYVSISDSDRSPDLDYIATIHHGIDFREFTARETADEDGHLVAFGRMHPDKGIDTAIEIARRSGRRIVLCGIVQDADYFRERVLPHVDDDRVVYLGSVGPDQRDEVLGGAAALLHPVRFAEPFGLSVVEAMACGTPAVAYRTGSMPEIINDGVTGYVVNDLEEAVAAVELAASLDRGAVRARAFDRFEVERMVDGYLAVYEELLARTGS
ncbi:glycosyltransferase family 4 protein [Planctomonas deserti]|uniref:glycosyltransferase family 4 protein n=1 Tax=Planctomonas deserti TaxID=2144185 RepID=UPI000D3CE760|nr:glycosyltransferase family 4 protein [Planctomonas deserti]